MGPGTESADRAAIRELVDAYARCADRRDAAGQKSLFTQDTHFVVYMEGQDSEPTQVLDGRESLTPVFDDLNPEDQERADLPPVHDAME